MVKLKPVQFDKPPVVEVVFGIMFQELPALRVPYFGAFWSRIREQFPQIEERPPIDIFPEPLESGTFQIQFSTSPPMPRIWMLAEDGKSLLQLQKNWLLYNWKKQTNDDTYPSYGVVAASFEKYLKEFQSFLEVEKLGEISPQLYEMTYVNHIGQGLEIGDAVTSLADHVHVDKSRFLPSPAGYDWRTAYSLPDSLGKLDVRARSAKDSEGKPVLRMDMVARGLGSDLSDKGRKHWFDTAHDWITHGFADVTTEKWHKTWGRTQ